MKRTDLLRAVGREPLFSTGMLLSPGVSLQKVRKQLSRWTADGTVVQIRRGLYALGEPYRTVEPHPYEVSNALVPGSYVSLETVLADHGLIPEAVFATTAVTTGRPGPRTTPFGTFVYQHLKADLFWGYRTQAVGGNRTAFVAAPEKALLDLSYLRGRSGEPAFTRELRLQRLDSVDLERLATMAQRFNSRKVERFAGNVAALARAEAEEYQDL
jgi:predicted transcriptional regulator of viral defense system